MGRHNTQLLALRDELLWTSILSTGRLLNSNVVFKFASNKSYYSGKCIDNKVKIV